MSEHYTKNTLEASAWCNRCNQFTMHRIDDGRRGPCLNCMKVRPKEVQKAEPEQQRLFE